MRFTKMHGLGNDYVFVSLFDQRPDVGDWEEVARRISDRHYGVGGDGLIVVEPPRVEADARMRMFNHDGTPGEMCGNGLRCVAKLVYERGWARSRAMRIETDAGILVVELTLDERDRVSSVRVDMGTPALEPRRIPVALGGSRVVAAPLPLPDRILAMTCVSLGNPHAVILCDALDDVPLARWGPLIERHPLFPQRVNVHFAQVESDTRIRMRTWERGSGATLACGTGACAVCVAGVLNGLTQRAVTIALPGGELQLAWDETNDRVYMSGPATEVCRGEWLP